MVLNMGAGAACVRSLVLQYLDSEGMVQLRATSTDAEPTEVLANRLGERMAESQAAQGMYDLKDVANCIRSYAITAASNHIADKELAVRGQALKSLSVLSQKGDRVVVGKLLKAAAKGKSVEVRSDALAALSQFACEDDPAVSAVVAACLDDESCKIRAAATGIFCQFAVVAPELFIQDFATTRRCSTFPVPSSVSTMLGRVAQAGGERVVAVMHEALGPGYMKPLKKLRREPC